MDETIERRGFAFMILIFNIVDLMSILLSKQQN